MKKQKIKRLLIITFASLAVTLFAVQIILFSSGRTRSYHIEGTRMSYVRESDVRDYTRSFIQPKQLVAGDNSFVVVPKDIGLEVDSSVVDKHIRSDRNPLVLIPIYGLFELHKTNEVPISFLINQQKLESVSKKITETGKREPIDASVTVDGEEIVIEREKTGIELEQSMVYDALKKAFQVTSQKVELEAKEIPARITVKDLEGVVESLKDLRTKSLTVTIDELEFVIKSEDVATFATVVDAQLLPDTEKISQFVADWSLKISKPAGVTQEEYYDDQLVSSVKGTNGVTINNDEIISTIAEWTKAPSETRLQFHSMAVYPRVVRTYRYSKSSEQLQRNLDAWVNAHPGRYMIAVQELNGQGRQATVNGDRSTVMASTYKMFLSYVAYKLSENGQLDLSQNILDGKTTEQCIEMGIVYSDNPCPIAIGKKIGWQYATDIVRGAGFSSVNLNNYNPDGSFNGDKMVNANDQAKFLMQLSAGSLLSSENTSRLLGYMKRQVYRDGIPAGSGQSVVADKVGFLDGYYYHDVGIVYGPSSTYALVILTEESGWSYIRDVAEAVYEFMQE